MLTQVHRCGQQEAVSKCFEGKPSSCGFSLDYAHRGKQRKRTNSERRRGAQNLPDASVSPALHSRLLSAPASILERARFGLRDLYVKNVWKSESLLPLKGQQGRQLSAGVVSLPSHAQDLPAKVKCNAKHTSLPPAGPALQVGGQAGTSLMYVRAPLAQMP